MSREFFEEKAISRYEELVYDFLNLAINRFKWKNLPLGLTSERIEEMLIRHGQLMFFKDTTQGYFILKSVGMTDLNVYGVPTKYRVMGANGYNEEVDIEEGVLIKNNPMATSDIETIEIFAKRIDDIEMTQDVNLFQQNVPKLILTEENSKLTAKSLISELRKFKFAIFGKKSLTTNISTSDVLDTSSPYVLDKLQEFKNDLRNELLNRLGINTLDNGKKKERLITDEVNANNEYVSIILDLMYDLRVQACNEINEMFGYEIEVEKREVEENVQEKLPVRGDNTEN